MKILVLDADDMSLGQLSVDVEKIDVEGNLFPEMATDPYTPPSQFFLNFLAQLQPGSYDLVVVGNNLGAGLAKVASLPVAFHAHTIIVFNNAPDPATKLSYLTLGYRYFVLRDQLITWLEANRQVYISQ
jgi:hypothetical protein